MFRSDRYKILNICTVNMGKNGITSCIVNYSNQIISDKMKIDIAASGKVENDVREQIKNDSIRIFELPDRKKNIVRYCRKLFQLLYREKYDIVHVHGNSCTMAIELLIAMLAGCKVRAAHSHNTTCKYKGANFLFRPLFELCCNVRIACGQEAGKWLYRRKKFTVIKNGIDFRRYKLDVRVRKEIREKYQIDNTTVLLGHIGKFNFQKNQEFLIPLIEILKRNSKRKYKLMLIGDGEAQKDIIELISQKGLREDIILTGNIQNVSDYLQAMDIFVLPSRFEGLPYVLVEAQAMALPCCVSDAVSPEAKMSNDFQFIDLNFLNEWVERIERLSKMNNFKERCQHYWLAQQQLEEYGYNIRKSAEELWNLYEGAMDM